MFKGQKKLSTGTNTRIPLCPVFALLLSKNYVEMINPQKKDKNRMFNTEHGQHWSTIGCSPKKRKSNWTLYIYRRYVQTVGYAWATFPSINILFAIFSYFHIFCILLYIWAAESRVKSGREVVQNFPSPASPPFCASAPFGSEAPWRLRPQPMEISGIQHGMIPVITGNTLR